MANGYYRFWSRDPIYSRIVELVKEKGALCPIHGEIHRDMRLFEGDVYEFGKAVGRKYPPNSTKLVGLNKEPTESFPATLSIATESFERLSELEKKFGLDSIPEERKRVIHPSLKQWI